VPSTLLRMFASDAEHVYDFEALADEARHKDTT
jgi:hypothetical protein